MEIDVRCADGKVDKVRYSETGAIKIFSRSSFCFVDRRERIGFNINEIDDIISALKIVKEVVTQHKEYQE